jgi:hypothetical protein
MLQSNINQNSVKRSKLLERERERERERNGTGLENKEINPCIYNELIFSKGAKNTQ